MSPHVLREGELDRIRADARAATGDSLTACRRLEQVLAEVALHGWTGARGRLLTAWRRASSRSPEAWRTADRAAQVCVLLRAEGQAASARLSA